MTKTLCGRSPVMKMWCGRLPVMKRQDQITHQWWRCYVVVAVVLNVDVVPNKMWCKILGLDIMVQWKFGSLSCLSYPFVAYITLQSSMNNLVRNIFLLYCSCLSMDSFQHGSVFHICDNLKLYKVAPVWFWMIYYDTDKEAIGAHSNSSYMEWL